MHNQPDMAPDQQGENYVIFSVLFTGTDQFITDMLNVAQSVLFKHLPLVGLRVYS
jgi:hypothetical protein